MASEPTAHSAFGLMGYWDIDWEPILARVIIVKEPIRARGIIVKYRVVTVNKEKAHGDSPVWTAHRLLPITTWPTWKELLQKQYSNEVDRREKLMEFSVAVFLSPM